MSRPDTAVEIFLDGHACSQAVLLAFAEDIGLDRTQAARMGSGFGGGMRLGSVCGAVSGAAMVLGLALSDENCVTGDGRAAAREAVEEFGDRFTERMGSVECPGILECDIRTPEGSESAKAGNLYKTVCCDAVRTAAEVMDEMLPANK